MNITIGIVGLPNVGKSTLFNSLLKKQVAETANYPFCTIEPNVGIVEVPDERLIDLKNITNAQKIVPAVVEFYDIAGLVRGASQGEGLGNKFLSHIREVAVISHVIRFFDDENIIHVNNKVDPKSDLQIIESELIFADLSTLEKQKEPKGIKSKEQEIFFDAVKKIKDGFNSGILARLIKLKDEEKESVKQLNLLTMKPVMYVCNISEQQLENFENTKKIVDAFFEEIEDKSAKRVILCAKLESDVLNFSEEEQKEYLLQYSLEETGLNMLIKTAYESLNLISFLTAGEKEVRAWTILKGSTAPQSAGAIHTDFEKHFIRADIVSYELFSQNGGWNLSREKGSVQTVGKDYIMKDGDVVEFKVGV